MASWNVRTLRDTRVRKTAIVADELMRLRVDVAALSETRLADQGQISEKGFTFFWSGNDASLPRRNGVCFAVAKHIVGLCDRPVPVSDRISTMRMRLGSGGNHVTFVSVYAPTELSDDNDKDLFYEALENTLSSVVSRDKLIVLGDFNARVGRDCAAWSSLGRHGIGKMNGNGQRLLELCAQHRLAVTSTFFDLPDIYKTTWCHPRSGHGHQIDHILVRRRDLPDVLVTRTMRSAECGSDHFLVRSCLRLRLIWPKRQTRKERLDLSRLREDGVNKQLEARLSEVLPDILGNLDNLGNDCWSPVAEKMFSVAREVLGTNKKRSPDWFSESAHELAPLLESKRSAWQLYLANPNPETRLVWARCNASVQKGLRLAKERNWGSLLCQMERDATNGNSRGLFGALKLATEPTPRRVAPLKAQDGSLLKSKGEIMGRWTQHFTDLYSRSTSVSQAALERIPDFLQGEMEPNVNVPSEVELERVISKLKSGKSPGADLLPAEFFKLGGNSVKKALLQVIQRCWLRGSVPKSWRDSVVSVLYKGKGDRSDCNNYRGISLLSVAGKIMARILLNRITLWCDHYLPESQCGFRAGRSTLDLIFSFRQLQEKCREQGKQLHAAFVDLTKAFDLVSRQGLFSILRRLGLPLTLVSLVESFHENTEARVQFDGAISECFHFDSGVKQGCVLAPTLFAVFFACLLVEALMAANTDDAGVLLRTRGDSRLLKPSDLRSTRKSYTVLLQELLFADDCALVSVSPAGLQSLVHGFECAAKEYGVTISLAKTVVFHQGVVGDVPPISLNSQRLQRVDKFCYLGSIVQDQVNVDDEISARIGKAAVAFGSLRARVWRNSHLSVKTKIRIYRSCVLATLLYGGETWTLRLPQERRLNGFHMKCLRRILGISWQEHVPDTEVLSRSGMDSLFVQLKKIRLCWLGHVLRLPEYRIPRVLLLGELSEGARRRGRPLLRWKDCVKRDLKDLCFDLNHWQRETDDGNTWQAKVLKLCSEWEKTRVEKVKEKRAARKSRVGAGQGMYPDLVCHQCGRNFTARIGLISHLRTHAVNDIEDSDLTA